MRPRLVAGSLSTLVVLMATTTALALAQSSAKDKGRDSDSKKKPAVKKSNEKLYKIGMFAGKVLDIDEENQTLKVRVEGKAPVPTFQPGNPTS